MNMIGPTPNQLLVIDNRPSQNLTKFVMTSVTANKGGSQPEETKQQAHQEQPQQQGQLNERAMEHEHQETHPPQETTEAATTKITEAHESGEHVPAQDGNVAGEAPLPPSPLSSPLSSPLTLPNPFADPAPVTPEPVSMTTEPGPDAAPGPMSPMSSPSMVGIPHWNADPFVRSATPLAPNYNELWEFAEWGIGAPHAVAPPHAQIGTGDGVGGGGGHHEDNDNDDGGVEDEDEDGQPPRKRLCRHQTCRICDHREETDEEAPGNN